MGWIDRFNFQVFPSWAFGFVRRTSFGSIDGHQKMPRIWKQQATVTLSGHIIFCALMWLCCSFENLSRGRSGVLEMKSAVLHMTRRLAYGKLIRWMFFFSDVMSLFGNMRFNGYPLGLGYTFLFYQIGSDRWTCSLYVAHIEALRLPKKWKCFQNLFKSLFSFR